jgi:hypothetical protein
MWACVLQSLRQSSPDMDDREYVLGIMLSSVMGVLLVALRHEMGSVTLRSVVQELNLSSSQSAYITRNEMMRRTASLRSRRKV